MLPGLKLSVTARRSVRLHLRPSFGEVRRQAESHLRQMVDGIELLALTLDLQAPIAYANPALAASADMGQGFWYASQPPWRP